MFVLAAPGAELVAARFAEDAALPEVGSVERLRCLLTAAAGERGSRLPGPGAGAESQGRGATAGNDRAGMPAVCVIPAEADTDAADSAMRLALSAGIPVDDYRGRFGRDSERAAAVAELPAELPAEDRAGDVVLSPHAAPKGRVTLVGGGPGDPGLVTVAGTEAIRAADVILADHLGPYELAQEQARRGAEVIDVSKLPYGRQVSQERINDLLVDHALRGRCVVRLKGGDPFLFGRGFEEAVACAEAGVDCRVIPGVSSAMAGPAAGGVSLTHRGLVHDVSIISGHLRPDHPKSLVNWSAVAGSRGTVVLVMAVRNAQAIAAELLREGMDTNTPVTAVENATLPAQRVVRSSLVQVARDGVDVSAPAVIVLGAAAGTPLPGHGSARPADSPVPSQDAAPSHSTSPPGGGEERPAPSGEPGGELTGTRGHEDTPGGVPEASPSRPRSASPMKETR